MTSDRRDKGSHRIPIKFTDADEETRSADSAPDDMDKQDPDQGEDVLSDADYDFTTEDLFGSGEVETEEAAGGPDTAELIATRAELKRVEAENAELKDRLARRQADFENYRKR
ncbi:MAG TPA: hypothetical protein VF435_10460, partial [Pyrinomonadaceae bacterium]